MANKIANDRHRWAAHCVPAGRGKKKKPKKNSYTYEPKERFSSGAAVGRYLMCRTHSNRSDESREVNYETWMIHKSKAERSGPCLQSKGWKSSHFLGLNVLFQDCERAERKKATDFPGSANYTCSG
jgi:hypothetical protein